LEFQKVFQYSEKDKWDDAQLKLGLSYKSIGNRERAKDEFQKLLDHYPNSEYTQKAQQYLRQL
ncbi:MAG: tol-pal system YbgF family protein, partial [Fidelibacterota bacterium]